MTDSDSPTVSAVPPGDDSTPVRIGPYQLLERIGEGGMGEVWLAEQEEPVHRRVALKLIKLGMDTREVVARFEAERQALAMMNHPNVARVIDAGSTDQGRPYFVMEYIPGVSINEYCDQERLSTVERLDLFKQVCQGVQHAHQKGILHRDIKPSNILVMTRDGVPVPKIIDFGVAKAVDHRLTEKTLFTKQGQLIGTPAYMSPEQAEFRGLEVDTRSDVYSLGVLLYELLIGEPPFDLEEIKRGALEEVVRHIKESEPHRPSTKLSTHRDAAGNVIALNRRTNTTSLIRQIRGDLDWITMKAMEKEVGRRYGSVSEFAADIDRYLADDPVLAGPPTAAYRAGKLLKKHRGLCTAVALILIAVSAGLIVSLSLYSDLRKESHALGQALEGLGLDLSRLRPDADNTAILDQQRAILDATFVGKGRTEIELRRALGYAYFFEGEIERAEEQWELAIQAGEGILEESSPLMRELRRSLADARIDLARTQDRVVAASNTASADDDTPARRGVTAANRAAQAYSLEDWEEAERLASESVEILETVAGAGVQLATARFTLGAARSRLAKYDEAERLLDRASDVFYANGVYEFYLDARRVLAKTQFAQDKKDLAESTLLEALRFCVNTKDKAAFAGIQRESKRVREALIELYDTTDRPELAAMLRALSAE